MLFKKPTFHGEEPEHEDVRADAALEEAVANRLAEIGTLDASDLMVVASGGEILLTGSMATHGEIERAVEAVLAIPGVTKVSQNISLR